MPICCCGHRTPKSRLGSLLFSLPIVVALHVFSFVVEFHASRAFSIAIFRLPPRRKRGLSPGPSSWCVSSRVSISPGVCLPQLHCPVESPRRAPTIPTHGRGPRDLPTDGRVVSGARARDAQARAASFRRRRSAWPGSGTRSRERRRFPRRSACGRRRPSLMPCRCARAGAFRRLHAKFIVRPPPSPHPAGYDDRLLRPLPRTPRRAVPNRASSQFGSRGTTFSAPSGSSA